jgi:hypothetical protein
MDKLHAELGYQMSLEVEDDDDNYLYIPKEEEIHSHFVGNEEADEDYRSTLVQDEQRYEKRKASNGVTQLILDYIENTGPSTYTELNQFYRFITGGSNSFSHILKALRIPYKNRYTRRYLVKDINGKYIVKLANPSNWVEKYH